MLTSADGVTAEPLASVRAHSQSLLDNEWLSLRVVRRPEVGVGGYVYSHESRCQGRIVAVLPYDDGPEGRRYLVKSEMTPCWSFDRVLSAITGGYEGGDIEDDAVREMLEETGYAVTRDELIPLGESYASKSADTVYSLFSVNLSGRIPGEALGDGTRVESESKAVWIDSVTLASVLDPQVAVMYLRLKLTAHRWPPNQSEVVITDDGRQEAARRGLVLSDKAGPRRCSSCERSGGDLTENGCPEHGDNDLAG